MFRKLLPIAALLTSTAFMLAGGGVYGIVLPVRGGMEGFSTTELGLIGTCYAIGFTLGCIYIPLLVRQVGHVRTFGALAAILATTVLLCGLFVNAFTWMILRTIAGFWLAGGYMIIESWLNEKADNENRGVVFSIYMVTSQVAMMCGQYMLVLADPGSDVLFMWAAILYALAVVPTALSKAQSPAPLTESKFDVKKLYQNSPAAAFGAVMQGIISGIWISFAPVYGTQMGMSNINIANIVVFAMVGSIIFQIPLGRISDRMDRRYIIIGSSICGAFLGLFIGNFVHVTSSPGAFFFGMMLVFGGFIYPIYGIVVAHANDHAEPHEFVQISSSLLILYGIGTIIGPVVVGPVMDHFGPTSLFTVMGVAHIILAAYVGWRVTRRSAPMELEMADMPILVPAIGHTPESYALDPRSDAEYYESNGDEDK